MQRVILSYDIACQWGKHMIRRFETNQLPGLQIPEILLAVGVWHIYAHVKKCFGRFAPVYLLHAGLIDGEIVETLWSRLNPILESCQTMSLANREETINYHMNDINKKKNTEMSKRLNTVPGCAPLSI